MRGLNDWTDSAIARMWSGVVPQQPPVMLSQPLCAQSRMKPAVSFGQLVVLRHRVRQPRVGMRRDVDVGDARELLDVRDAAASRRARS
jgi:hypothetical protein